MIALFRAGQDEPWLIVESPGDQRTEATPGTPASRTHGLSDAILTRSWLSASP